MPIGVPEEAEIFVGPGDVHSLVSRDSDSHKGDNGRILIIGGGAYVGAPALTALAALRTGADIATIAAPASVSDIIASFSPDLIVSSLTSDVLTPDDLPIITELVQEHDVVVIGMGLGRDELTRRAIKAIVPICKKVVIDADALSALDLPLDGSAIITPHAGEFKRVTGRDIPKDGEKRTALVKKFAKENNIVVLLKGKMDIISDGTSIKMNKTGNVGMTVGGTGDVLAGTVGAFYAKNDAFESAAAGAFITGLAGDIAFEEYGFGLLATDVMDRIPKAIKGRKMNFSKCVSTE
ncbi:MAG: NAD(P)H-hydrate dehydratase [Methanocellales archaeon]|nr:NAD(P)H-hydrate dehydratase [Methanocellales archaeon]